MKRLLLIALTFLACLPATAARLELNVSKTAQRLVVQLDGKTVATYPVSTGKERRVYPPSGGSYVAHTPSGSFGVAKLERRHESRTWQVPMNYAVFFTEGCAIHATLPQHYRMLGRRDSGGCVRLTLSAARSVYRLVQKIGPEETQISIS